MTIRRFAAATMQLALREVKAALGPDAVILDTAEAQGQVVVTAAVDLADGDQIPPLASPPMIGPASDPELLVEVRRLLDVVHQLVDDQWRRPRPELRPDVARLHRGLVAQGVDGVIAAALVRATAERLEHAASIEDAVATALAGRYERAASVDDAVAAALAGRSERAASVDDAVAAALAGRYERAASVDDAVAAALATDAASAAARRVRLFVGPPGDGKTTTIVKLAAQAERAGRRVALISADTYRIGAAAELQTYGRALGVPVTHVADAGGLGRALAHAADADLVLVDTAGAAPGQEAQLAELAALTAAAGPDAGRTLVASAATGSWAAAQTWEAFAPLGPDSCVLTKLDVAPGAPLLGVCWRRGLPVSHVSAGRRIPDDLEVATPERLARCLLAA